MSLTVAPIDGITDENRSGVVLVFVIAASCISILFTIVRFGTATQKHLGFGTEDALFILSLVNLLRIARLLILTRTGSRHYARHYNRLRSP
jgi:hypothetical protein